MSGQLCFRTSSKHRFSQPFKKKMYEYVCMYVCMYVVKIDSLISFESYQGIKTQVLPTASYVSGEKLEEKIEIDHLGVKELTLARSNSVFAHSRKQTVPVADIVF